MRNFWHQAVLGNRTGRYFNYRFCTSGPRNLAFLLVKSRTVSTKSVILVPSATSTKHYLVPKVSFDQGATFGTKQCLVLVAEGTDFAKTAKSNNRKILLFMAISNFSGFGAVKLHQIWAMTSLPYGD